MTRFACFLFSTLLLSFSYAAITPTSPLSIGQTLSSPNGVFELGFFSPNNSHNLYVGIWFKGIIPRTVVWVANRENSVTDATANLAISSNGSLLLFDGKHGIVWSTGETFASNGSSAELSDSGNLLVIDKVSGITLWQSFEHLSDTMLPYSSLMYNPGTGEKRVLSSWKSYTDPSPGEFVGYITTQVPPQGFIMRGSKPYWRSGPWAKTRFTGVPLTDESYTHPFSVQQDANGSVYFSHLQRNFKRSFLVLTSEGSLKVTHHNGTDWVFSVGGELLSIRLASSEMGGNQRKKTIIASIVSISLFVTLASAAFGFWRYRLKHNAIVSKVSLQGAWRNDLKSEDVSGLYFFEMKTIEIATNNFSPVNKLGQGGFGPVYKGKLQDGKEIAVKRLSSSSGQGKEEFMNEILLISKLQHINLVRILGCCIEGEERLLVYEFMVNKSLDTFIFDSRKRVEIDWPKRFSIIQGIARGLLYLHRDSRLRIIHRDVKVSNILLDDKMNPKISDFGLARMYEGTKYQDNTRRIVGTLGYMSPEYAWTGLFSEKSDTYSFGVLLLEVISGEKISRFSYDKERKNLLAYAWESWCENGGVDFLDKDVADSCHPSEVGRCVQIGLLCVQHQPTDRPNTLELLSMLTTTSDLPLPKEPTFAVHTSDDGSRTSDLITVNEVTQSVVLGR